MYYFEFPLIQHCKGLRIEFFFVVTDFSIYFTKESYKGLGQERTKKKCHKICNTCTCRLSETVDSLMENKMTKEKKNNKQTLPIYRASPLLNIDAKQSTWLVELSALISFNRTLLIALYAMVIIMHCHFILKIAFNNPLRIILISR